MFNEIYRKYGMDSWRAFGKKVNGFHELDKHSLYGRITYRSDMWDLTVDTFSRIKKDNRVPSIDGGFYMTEGNMEVEDFTRIVVPFENGDGFICKIYEETYFSKIGKIFGMQDIIIENPAFDERFIIKANDDSKVWMLLLDERVRDLILYFPDIHLKVNSKKRFLGGMHPEGRNELYIETKRIIDTLEELENINELAILLINKLCKLDSICRKQLKKIRGQS